MNKRYIKAIPNVCSMANLFFGLLAILMTVFHKTEEAIHLACFFLLVGAFLDSIDGLLARYLDATSQIGKELDSFADIITFGIAPIIVFTSLHSIGHNHYIHVTELFVAAFYVICAVYRLARYNVSEYKPYFEGLPTTAAGIIMSFYIILSNECLEVWEGDIYYTFFSYAMVIALGVLMVSKIRVNRIGNIIRNRKNK